MNIGNEARKLIHPFGSLGPVRGLQVHAGSGANSLPFLHREGRIYSITRPGRKLRNLQAAPRGVCFQLDLTEGAGWTSVCAWGDYHNVDQLRERLSILSASFTKYPDRTTHQAVSWLRSH